MHLESNVVIRRTPKEVWNFLGDASNIPKWDRGVAGVQQTSTGPAGVGFEFDTLAHPRRPDGAQDWGRMSYRVSKIMDNHCTIQLTSSDGNARFFKTAQWTFWVEPVPEGARVKCSADFVLRLRYIILAPIFLALKSAIRRDLENLKRVLEQTVD